MYTPTQLTKYGSLDVLVSVGRQLAIDCYTGRERAIEEAYTREELSVSGSYIVLLHTCSDNMISVRDCQISQNKCWWFIT
jgi:hypothetical protein